MSFTLKDDQRKLLSPEGIEPWSDHDVASFCVSETCRKKKGSGKFMRGVSQVFEELSASKAIRFGNYTFTNKELRSYYIGILTNPDNGFNWEVDRCNSRRVVRCWVPPSKRICLLAFGLRQERDDKRNSFRYYFFWDSIFFGLNFAEALLSLGVDISSRMVNGPAGGLTPNQIGTLLKSIGADQDEFYYLGFNAVPLFRHMKAFQNITNLRPLTIARPSVPKGVMNEVLYSQRFCTILNPNDSDALECKAFFDYHLMAELKKKGHEIPDNLYRVTEKQIEVKRHTLTEAMRLRFSQFKSVADHILDYDICSENGFDGHFADNIHVIPEYIHRFPTSNRNHSIDERVAAFYEKIAKMISFGLYSQEAINERLLNIFSQLEEQHKNPKADPTTKNQRERLLRFLKQHYSLKIVVHI